MRHFAAVSIVLAVFWSAPEASQGESPTLDFFSQAQMQRHGLLRAWVTQVAIDPSRNRLSNVLLEGPQLFVQTDKSLIQALDAETGGKQWTAQVGNRDYPTSPPAANETQLALANGTTLYILDRFTGKTLRELRLRWVPNGYVAMNKNWVYVPGLIGQVEVFGLIEPYLKWNCGSYGRIDMPPLMARSSLVWGTDKGYVYFCATDSGNIDFRLQTNGPVGAAMGYWPPIVLAASRDGYLYAIHERSGDTLWRFSLGNAVSEAPIALGGVVYVVGEAGGMYCLSCEDGTVRWFSPRAARILAVTPTCAYVADRLGNLLILDAKTGGHLQTLDARSLTVKYTNVQNDRLYLGTDSGLLMCLRELPLKEPLPHVLPQEALEGEAPTEEKEAPAGVPPSDPANPFGVGVQPK